MRQYEVLMDQELYYGSDVIRAFAYKTGAAGEDYALFWDTDCFVCCSPFGGMIGSVAGL